MKQIKTCRSSQVVIILAILLCGCGNKGPLVPPSEIVESAKTAEPSASGAVAETVETKEKETKK